MESYKRLHVKTKLISKNKFNIRKVTIIIQKLYHHHHQLEITLSHPSSPRALVSSLSLRMSSTTIGEHIRLRRARNQTIRHLDAAEDDPPLSHVVLPISQPNRFCNSAMSSFFLLPTSSSNESTKKKPYQTASFRGMGCTAAAAAQEVSVPSVIRSSADWDKKKHKKKNKRNKGSYEDGSIRILSEARDVDGGGCVAIPDVWCVPGLGFSTDAVVDRPVDPPRRRNLQSSRRKIDVDINNFNPTQVNLVN